MGRAEPSSGRSGTIPGGDSPFNRRSKETSALLAAQKLRCDGFDVLQALEKARARKMKKRRNGTSSLLNSRKVIGEGRKGTPEDSPLTDYGNNKIVRAFNIKEDWGTRLDELEKRLQQLVDTTPAA